MILNSAELGYKAINDAIRSSTGDCMLTGCCGQRFIAAGMQNKSISIEGIPGNALGAYLNGADITVHGNAQDAVGDTMNNGEIIIHGNIGDAAGYAMRGGKILVKGNAGYRAGIHMKEYNDKIPLIVIGGSAGSFLGEYQAGGVIIVLGLEQGEKRIIGDFPCTGMHGGRMYLRSDGGNITFPDGVSVHPADEADKKELAEMISEFCALFGYDCNEVLHAPFIKAVPDSKNPYKQMYAAN